VKVSCEGPDPSRWSRRVEKRKERSNWSKRKGDEEEGEEEEQKAEGT
jgi:hypothetical protein